MSDLTGGTKDVRGLGVGRGSERGATGGAGGSRSAVWLHLVPLIRVKRMQTCQRASRDVKKPRPTSRVKGVCTAIGAERWEGRDGA